MRTLVFAGYPADWVTNRIDLSVIAASIEESTDYQVKLLGGYGGGTPDRFWPLLEGEIDISPDISGMSFLLEELKEVDPDLAAWLPYLGLLPLSVTPLPLIVHADLPISSVKDAIDKKYSLRIGLVLVGRIW